MSHMPPECSGPCYCGPDPVVAELVAALKALVPDAGWGDDLPRVKQARAAIARVEGEGS